MIIQENEILTWLYSSWKMLHYGMSGCFTPTKELQQKAKSLCAIGEVQSQLQQKGNTFYDQQDWR